MKKIATLLIFLVTASTAFSQYFSDDFESYTVNLPLGPQSAIWTTWSGIDGGPDDVNVANNGAHSGSQSLYFNSPFGGGPNDVVLPFGGVHSSGRFKFTAWFNIPSGKSAYFNFQGGTFVGSTWSMDCYLDAGNFNMYGNGSLSGSYPQGSWFEMVIDCNLDTDVWEVFINGASVGTFSNPNPVSYLDLYPANSNSEWWVDDISFCVNSACNPEISVETIAIAPSPVCTHHTADVTVKLKNNSSFGAKQMELGVDVGNNRITQMLTLNGLAGGKDTTITIPGMFVSKVSGASVQVKGINLSGDVNAANDTAKTNIVVNPSPSGAAVVKGTPFKTTRPLSSGTIGDPDVVAESDVLTFEIMPPNGFSNSGHTTTWSISNFELRTSTGRLLTSNPYYLYSNPSGSANAKVTFTPDSLLSDSLVIISFSVRNIANGCDSMLKRYIYVAPRPKSGFNGPNVCDKQSVNFVNTSSIKAGVVEYLWDFGDGTTSNLTQPSKLYAIPGSYNVKLLVTSSFGYVDSITQTVQVFQIPTANFNFTNACEGTAVVLTDNSTLPTGTPTYDWNFGDNSTGSGPATSRLYAQPGIYNVMLTVTVNGCPSTITKYVTQAPRTLPDFTFPATQCDNGAISFTNTTPQPVFGSASFFWKFGDGDEASETSPNHVYNSFQAFNVVMISSTDLGCKDSVTKVVTLRESPAASFTMSAAKCNNEPITFTNTSVVPSGSTNSYSWEFGDANASSNANPTHQYSAPGTYIIVLKSVSTNGCSGQTQSSVTVALKPTADFAATEVCSGNATQFSNASFTSDNAALTYMWKFGNGDSSATLNPTLTYATFGTYNVSLSTMHPNGCTDTKTSTVKVFETPVVTISNVSANTGNGGINFATNATGTGYTYTWLFGDGATSNQQNPSYTYGIDGRMIVHLTVETPDGCSATAADTLWINMLGLPGVDGLEGVSVYPNPSAGKFVLDLSKANSADIKAISVTDMLGRTVINGVDAVAGLGEIDLTAQAAGIYYLNITTTRGTHTVKLNVAR